jgi:hypothetical protein
MKRFACSNCEHVVYFENVRCERCQQALGYSAVTNEIWSLVDAGNGVWQNSSGQQVRYCANARFAACNWLVPSTTDNEDTLCEACALNRTIPDVSSPENLARWQRLEFAKHRLVYSLHRLRLPLENGHDVPGGLLFDFLANYAENGKERRVTTGHADGVITVDVAEADAAVRTVRRQQLGERFRTLLGHFRHEAGHYYFTRLIPPDLIGAFRELFGDESADYAMALEIYYRDGPDPSWNQRFISAYASSHPHEDWAETFAHYLHIVDTLDTAYGHGLALRPEPTSDDALKVDVEAYAHTAFERLWELWIPLTIAINALNRSMGHDDLYPFVLPPAAIDKLRFAHRVIG